MPDPFRKDYPEKRDEQYFNIEPKGSVVQVMFVKCHFLVGGDVIPPVDLSPTRQTGKQLMNAPFCPQINQVILEVKNRSGPHKTHIAPEDTI